MDAKQRSIVRCSTREALHSLLEFAEKRGWGEGVGLFCWDDYGDKTALLLVGTSPNGYAPFSYYEKHHNDFMDALIFPHPEAFFKQFAPEALTEKPKEVKNMNAGNYLAAIAKASNMEPPKPDMPAHAVQAEPEAPQFFGRIETYRYALIENSKSTVEVPEDEFQANPKMKDSKNVQHFVRTTIYIGCDFQASATCKAEEYDERQGILEAMGNLVCQNFCDMQFQTFYRKMQKDKEAYEKHIRKCPLCGTVYDTPEEVQACLEQHAENKKASAERRKLRKIARYELKQEEYRKRVNEMKQQLLEEDKKAAEEAKTAEEVADEIIQKKLEAVEAVDAANATENPETDKE